MSGCRQIDATGRVIEIPIAVESGGPEAIAAFLAAQAGAAPAPEDVTDE